MSIHHEVVDQWCKCIHEQDGKHSPLWISRIHTTDQDRHHPDQEAVDQLTDIGVRGGHGVSCHKDSGKSKTTVNQMVMCRHCQDAGCAGCDKIHAASHHDHTHYSAQHDAPAADAGGDQQTRSQQNGECGCLTNRTGYQTDKSIAEGKVGKPAIASHAKVIQGLNNRAGLFASSDEQRRCAGVAVDELEVICCHQLLHPGFITGDAGRIGEEDECTSDKCRIEDVHTRTTEDFLTDNHTEGYPDSNLPERYGWRNDQGDKHTCYQEALIDLVLAHN